MKKGDTTKTILIVGGSIAGLYILAKSGAFEKAQQALGGSLPSIGINLPLDLGLGSQLPLDLESLRNSMIKLPQINLPDLLPDNTCPSCVTNPPEHATVPDVIYSMPSWAKGAIGVSASILGAYGGYQLLRFSAPALRQVGIVTAKAIGGAGSVVARALSGRATAQVAAKTATSIVPKVGATAASRGILGGFLPALAFTGIVEGAYQIFRTITGARNIGMTGVPPLDIFNVITGRSDLTSATPVPSLLFGNLFSTAVGAEPAAINTPFNAAGGKPAAVAPSTYITQTQARAVAAGITPTSDRVVIAVQKAAQLENRFYQTGQ